MHVESDSEFRIEVRIKIFSRNKTEESSIKCNEYDIHINYQRRIFLTPNR